MVEAENVQEETVQEDSAKETVRNVLDRRRSFIFDTLEGESVEYFIADPTGEDIRKADWNYAKVFNQAMSDSFPTQSQMLEVLEERGIISSEYHTEVERVRIGLAAALFRLENMSELFNEIEREGTALEVAEMRDKLFKLNQKVNGPLGNTCENMAEDARTEFLTSRIIQDKDAARVWEDFEAFRSEQNTAFCVKCRLEVMLWLQGLDSNFLENTPEQAALREIAQSRLDAAIGAADASEKAAAEEKAEEEQPAVGEPETVVPVTEEPVTEELVTEEPEVLAPVVEELKLPKEPKKPVRKKTAAKRKPGRPRGSKSKKEEKPKDA